MREIKQPLLILAALLVVAGAFVFLPKAFKENNVPKDKTEEPVIIDEVSSPKIVKAKEGEMPEGFPENIPLNNKSEITQAYNAKYIDQENIKQSTIAFKSASSIEENYNFYLNWAKKNNWNVINKINQASSMIIHARKENGQATADFNVTVLKNGEPNSETNPEIAITYTEF